MATRHVARLAAMLALMSVAGCQGFPTWDNPFNKPPLAVRLDERNASAAVTVERNQTLVVTLEANVTTGYRWETVAGFTPVLAQIGTADYVARSADASVAGAPGDMTFRFRGESSGATTLEFAYRRPFEPGVAPAKTVRYDVTVR
jgi:inhibitor of cysteine peptidase